MHTPPAPAAVDRRCRELMGKLDPPELGPSRAAAVLAATVAAGEPTKEEERGRKPSVVLTHRVSADRAAQRDRAMVAARW